MVTVSELLATDSNGYVLAANFFTDDERFLYVAPQAEVMQEEPLDPHFWLVCEKNLFEMAEGSLDETFVFAVQERLETSLWVFSFRINKQFHFYVPPERMQKPY